MKDTVYRDDVINALIAEGRNVDSRYLESERIIHESDAVEAIAMLPSAREKYHVAQERYEDLCEYFGYNEDTIKCLLGSRKEFKSWLERMHWHVLECDKLAKMLDAQPEIIRCK